MISQNIGSRSPVSKSCLFSQLDDVVHQRTRLGLLCVLSAVDERDFNGLRRDLKLSDGNLARHITVLRAADLVEADQRLTDKHRRRTYLRLTDLGRTALAAELATMAAIIAEHEATALMPMQSKFGT